MPTIMLHISECVSLGHPDKIADYISCRQLDHSIAKTLCKCLFESGLGGHRITAERTSNGELFFYDAQSGEVIKEESSKVTLALFSTLYEFDSKAGVQVMRVDNKLINPDIIDGIVRVKRTRRSKSKV